MSESTKVQSEMGRAVVKGAERRFGQEVGMAGMALRACRPEPSGLAMTTDF